MTEVHSSRFKDAPWFPTEETNVIVGGAGGIGSWLTLMLSRAGFYPIVYDFDRLEEHNLAGQLYGQTDAKAMVPKVDALKGLCKNFADTDITVMNEKYTKDSMSHHYVFSAFDNMQARKDMFASWCEYVKEWQEEKVDYEGQEITYSVVIKEHQNGLLQTVKHVKDYLKVGLKEAKDMVDARPFSLEKDLSKDEAILLLNAVTLSDINAEMVPCRELEFNSHTPIFIDGRLTAEQLTIFCVTPDKIEDYKEHLFDDSEVEDAPCTMKQTSHSAAMIASHMTGFFTNHFANNQIGENDRNIPFMWEYFIPINYINEI